MATQSEEERIVIVISLLLSELRLFLVLFLRLYLAVRRRRVSSRNFSLLCVSCVNCNGSAWKFVLLCEYIIIYCFEIWKEVSENGPT